MILTALGWVAYVSILGTYFFAARRGNIRLFHWANALGCFPLLAQEIPLHIWSVVAITGSFGAIGWLGVWETRRKPIYEGEVDRSSKWLGGDRWQVGGPGGYVVIDPDGPQG